MPPLWRHLLCMMIFMIIIQFVNGVNTVSIDFIKFLNMVGEWEGAALDDVFERSAEYSIWRYDMLTLLQQLRIFDNLLTDSDITLQVFRGLGDATGVSAILRVVRNIAERPRVAANEGAAAAQWDRETAMNEGRSTLDQIKTMAYTLFEKSLPFDGTIMEMLEAITPQGNVLNLVHTLDGIFFPSSPSDKDEARAQFYSEVCQHGKHPAAYAAHLQKLRAKCTRLGYTISLSEFLVRVRTGLEKPYPHLTNTFNYLESVEQPAYQHTSDGVLTMAKYAKWISLVTKDFQKLYPDVTRKTTANPGAAGSALSVRANVDQDKPVISKRRFGQATSSTQRVSFQPQQSTLRNNRNNAHATANQPAGGVCGILWEDIRGVMRPCTGTTPCTRRHGKRAPGTVRRANLARQQAPEARFDETDLEHGHDDFEQEWAAHDHEHEDPHVQHQVFHARARHTTPSVERYNYLTGDVDNPTVHTICAPTATLLRWLSRPVLGQHDQHDAARLP